jgi:hypothetical protein
MQKKEAFNSRGYSFSKVFSKMVAWCLGTSSEDLMFVVSQDFATRVVFTTRFYSPKFYHKMLGIKIQYDKIFFVPFTSQAIQILGAPVAMILICH